VCELGKDGGDAQSSMPAQQRRRSNEPSWGIVAQLKSLENFRNFRWRRRENVKLFHFFETILEKALKIPAIFNLGSPLNRDDCFKIRFVSLLRQEMLNGRVLWITDALRVRVTIPSLVCNFN
jgi:hypothetical protein